MERPSSPWTGWQQPAFPHPSQILSPLFPFLVFSSWDQYWEAWEKTRYKGRSTGLLGISFKLDNWHPGWWRKGKVQWNQNIRWSEMNVDPSLRHLKSEFPQIIFCRPPPSPPWSSPKYQSPDPRQSSWPPKAQDPTEDIPIIIQNYMRCQIKWNRTEFFEYNVYWIYIDLRWVSMKLLSPKKVWAKICERSCFENSLTSHNLFSVKTFEN